MPKVKAFCHYNLMERSDTLILGILGTLDILGISTTIT